MEIILKSPTETKKLGEKIGRKIFQEKPSFFLALEGDLGSGKTTFLQGLAKGLQIKEKITSPTFVIFKKYKVEKERFFYHFDAYRIKEKDLDVLNFVEIIKDKNNIIAVEWSENIRKKIPQKAIKLKFSFINFKERRLIVNKNSVIIRDIWPS